MAKPRPNLVLARRLRDHVPWGSQSALARKLDLSPQRLSAYLTGRRGMTPDILKQICEALNINVGKIIGEEHRPTGTAAGPIGGVADIASPWTVRVVAEPEGRGAQGPGQAPSRAKGLPAAVLEPETDGGQTVQVKLAGILVTITVERTG